MKSLCRIGAGLSKHTIPFTRSCSKKLGCGGAGFLNAPRISWHVAPQDPLGICSPYRNHTIPERNLSPGQLLVFDLYALCFSILFYFRTFRYTIIFPVRNKVCWTHRFFFLNTRWGLLFTIIKFQITINDPWIPSHPFVNDRDIVVKMALTHASGSSKSCSANATVTIKCKVLGW